MTETEKMTKVERKKGTENEAGMGRIPGGSP